MTEEEKRVRYHRDAGAWAPPAVGESNTPSAGVSSLPVTQCLTAGVSNSVTAGERLVCAECGCGNFIQMRLFPYDFHTEADYPEEHPDRCRKLDDTFYEPPIMEDGKSRPHWRCYKKVGHDSTNGGRHCSTHRDCGARIEGSGRCGLEPGHDNGIHEGDGPYTSTRSAIGPMMPETCPDAVLLAMHCQYGCSAICNYCDGMTRSHYDRIRALLSDVPDRNVSK